MQAAQGALMRNGRARVVRLGLALLTLIAAVVWLQPYSVFSPYRAYTDPARRFLRAALARDSAELQRRAASQQPVAWALKAGGGDRNALAVWAERLRPYSGHRQGDTTTVVFQTNTWLCHTRPVSMTFIQDAGEPRVLVASSSCFAER
jgi:hypothetical protein